MLFELILSLLTDYAYELERLHVLEGFYIKYSNMGPAYAGKVDSLSGSIEFQLEELEELEELLALHGLKR
jgi:hypothetical protein